MATKEPAKSKKTTTKNEGGKGGIIAAIIVGVIVIIAAIVAVIMMNNKKDDDKGDSNNDNTSQTEDEEKTITNGKGDKITVKKYTPNGAKYSILVPTNFKDMSDDEIAEKYTNGQAPTSVLTNEAGDVNIAITTSDAAELKNDQIKEYLDAMKSVFETASDDVKTDYYEKDGHNIGNIKVVTEDTDGKEFYNNMIFFSVDDKLVAFAFNCDNAERDEWEKVGDEIVKSLEFKK